MTGLAVGLVSEVVGAVSEVVSGFGVARTGLYSRELNRFLQNLCKFFQRFLHWNFIRTFARTFTGTSASCLIGFTCIAMKRAALTTAISR